MQESSPPIKTNVKRILSMRDFSLARFIAMGHAGTHGCQIILSRTPDHSSYGRIFAAQLALVSA